MKLFFENYQFEGLYKLLITSINKNAVYYEYENDNTKIKEGFSSMVQDEKLIDFNIKHFFFMKKK